MDYRVPREFFSSLIRKPMKTYSVDSEDGLRKALAASGERTIVFSTPNIYINSHKDVIVNVGDVIIDGSGAFPVNIHGACLCIEKCKNVTLRNIRVRRGATGAKAPKSKKDKTVGESIAIFKADNVLLQHVTASWGTDETVSIRDCRRVSLDQCLISHPLDEPLDGNGKHIHYEKQPHGYSLLICASEVWIEACVLVHGRRRSPSVCGDGSRETIVAMRNCIVYNYGEHGTNFNAGASDQNKQPVQYTIQDNLYIPGKNTEGPELNIEAPRKGYIVQLCIKDNVAQKVWLAKSTNVVPVIEKKNNAGKIEQGMQYEIPALNHQQVGMTKLDVLNGAGALPRDGFDAQVIDHVRCGTGSFIDHENEVGYAKPK